MTAVLERRVTESRDDIYTTLESMIKLQFKREEYDIGCNDNCTVDAVCVASVITQLKECGLWPISSLRRKCLSDILGAMESCMVRDPDDLKFCQTGRHSECRGAVGQLPSDEVELGSWASKMRAEAQYFELPKLRCGE